jgi:Lipocalin-like domain
MRMRVALGVVCLFLGIATTTVRGSEERGDNTRIQERFAGAWRLVGLEEPDAEGKVHRADCTGLLAYTQDGHMSVQVMYKRRGDGRPKRACTICAGRVRGFVWDISN